MTYWTRLLAACLALALLAGCAPKRTDLNDPNLNVNASRYDPVAVSAEDGKQVAR